MSEFPRAWRKPRLLSNPTVLLNVAAPLAAYWVLSRHGVNTTNALAVSAVFPAAGAIATLARRRVLDPLAVLVLAAIAVGLVAGLVFHDGRILLLRESIVTGALGAAFLCSLLTRTPLMLIIRQRLAAAGQPGAFSTRDSGQRLPTALPDARRDSALWGTALLADAGARAGLSFLLPAGTLMAVSPFVAVVILGPVAIWTVRFRAADGAALAERPAERARDESTRS